MYLWVFLAKVHNFWTWMFFICSIFKWWNLNILYLMFAHSAHFPMKWKESSLNPSPHCSHIGESSLSILFKWYLRTLCPVNMCVDILINFLVNFFTEFHIVILTWGIVIFDCLWSLISSQYFWCLFSWN